jgi:hypothetical protein
MDVTTREEEPPIPRTREQFLGAALNWARNAYLHARDVKQADRTAECDESCAVALYNMGNISAMLGRDAEARQWYEECIAVGKTHEFAQAIAQARSGLDRLSGGLKT